MMYRFSCFFIPDDCCFTLICDTDRCNIFCLCIDHIHCFYRNTKHTCPDLICIMLYPARFWEILCEFSLCHTTHLTFLIKQNTSVTGSSCIQCHYIFCHIHFLLIFRFILLVTFSHAFYLNCSLKQLNTLFSLIQLLHLPYLMIG